MGAKLPGADLKAIIEALSRLTDELQTEVMQARLVPVGQIFERFPRLVRDLAKKEAKRVRLDTVGSDIELDRTILDEIGDPLIHLLKNAVDHGIETHSERKKTSKPEEAKITLSATREKSHVFIEVADDGKGMSTGVIKKVALKLGLVKEEELAGMSKEQILLLTAHPGFSTRQEVTEISGRGVGLDVVKRRTEDLGGSMLIESEEGKGTKIVMRLPITTAVVRALLVKVSGRVFAIPISSVLEIIQAGKGQIKKIENEETLLHRGHVLPVARFDRLFGEPAMEVRDSGQTALDSTASGNEAQNTDAKLNIVVLEFGSKKFGIVVDRLLTQQDIVIKQLTKELKGIRGFAGATILGDGSVALVLDVATLEN